jgi:hypothetical protein
MGEEAYAILISAIAYFPHRPGGIEFCIDAFCAYYRELLHRPNMLPGRRVNINNLFLQVQKLRLHYDNIGEIPREDIELPLCVGVPQPPTHFALPVRSGQRFVRTRTYLEYRRRNAHLTNPAAAAVGAGRSATASADYKEALITAFLANFVVDPAQCDGITSSLRSLRLRDSSGAM